MRRLVQKQCIPNSSRNRIFLPRSIVEWLVKSFAKDRSVHSSSSFCKPYHGGYAKCPEMNVASGNSFILHANKKNEIDKHAHETEISKPLRIISVKIYGVPFVCPVIHFKQFISAEFIIFLHSKLLLIETTIARSRKTSFLADNRMFLPKVIVRYLVEEVFGGISRVTKSVPGIHRGYAKLRIIERR